MTRAHWLLILGLVFSPTLSRAAQNCADCASNTQVQTPVVPHLVANSLEGLLPRPALSDVQGRMLEVEKKLLDLTNADRSKESVEPRLGELTTDPLLTAAALQHSDEMREYNYIGHGSPLDEHNTLGKRIRAAAKRLGVDELPRRFGENVQVLNSPRPLSVDEIANEFEKGFLSSPGHRENIMYADWSHVGIGAVEEDLGSRYRLRYRYFVTVVFSIDEKVPAEPPAH